MSRATRFALAVLIAGNAQAVMDVVDRGEVGVFTYVVTGIAAVVFVAYPWKGVG